MTVPAAENLRRSVQFRAYLPNGVVASVNTAADLLDAIDALHQPCDHHRFALVDRTHCDECNVDWPCPTTRLLHPAPKEDK